MRFCPSTGLLVFVRFKAVDSTVARVDEWAGFSFERVAVPPYEPHSAWVQSLRRHHSRLEPMRDPRASGWCRECRTADGRPGFAMMTITRAEWLV